MIDAGVTGQTATVRYFAAGTADLVVGIYSTDSKQLLASGTIQVEQTEETMAEIPLTGTLPQYFVLKVFLLDTEEHSALSDTYVSTLFTEEMSDLKEAKASDFDPELVVNLDEQDDTNFGVVKADVAVLDNDTVAPDENVITQDADSYVYTVENPTEEFRDLQAGDTFVYHSPEGLLVARVQDIQEEGGKLVITGDEELDIRDVFDLLKIDSDQDSSEFHYVEGSAESGADGSVTSNVTVQEPAMVDFSPEALEYTGEGADAIHAAADDAEADNGFVDDLTEEIGNIFEPKKDNKSKEMSLQVLMDKEYKKKYTDDLEYSVMLHVDSSVAVNTIKPQTAADSRVRFHLLSALVVLFLQILQALDGVFRGGVLQGGEHIGLLLFGKPQNGAVVAHAALPGTGGSQLPAGILPQEVLEVDHGHVLAQQFDGLGEHFLPAVHVFHVQKVHRIQQNLQIGAADLVQYSAGAADVIHDVLDHRLNGNGHAVLLGAAHHRLEVFDKGGKGSIAAALRAELVLCVGCTGLGAHHAAAQQAGKTDMRVVLFLNGVQSIRIRVRQIQVVAQHCNVQLVFGKQAAQIGRVAGGEGRGGVGHLLQGFAQCQMHAGKALLVHQRQHLLNGQLFRVVQTQTELDHAWFLLWFGCFFPLYTQNARGGTP